ncbi:3'(2'),5'-bisphosphate nucleotidase CysQ [Halomonas huangheensis]|uniref:3'(2'),5'-bisphosphate nucleotidase CysQ n=1 Tax=Halomonas huangheensis TaxID=1178482 RepID=W1NB04_9GAMM|nr:3'(2'),5'-bisphosphate nucleotidase CysQ [Halomonas huangheensis]ALM53733.1 3'(2'),5'-bisphosphate nucleotidase CysQ [Halomonas huangheensis]ERL52351.1 hypothetical protein BJB45_10315 [Halomonas huangheensis]
MSSFIEPIRQRLIDGSLNAGKAILDIYNSEILVETKDDDSPLTQADLKSHQTLVAMLEELTPDVPVLSEESAAVPFADRRQWNRYWLIDPLDGTKEFIKRNGEFTVNVALIEDGVPVFGIVHAPVLETTWIGEHGHGAFKITGNQQQSIQVRKLPDPNQEAWKIVGSRSHGSTEFEAFCERLPAHERVSMGSSLKLCLVAEGSADLYPRLAPTCEWDTAAAQAVVTAAGGEVLNAHTLKPLLCNQQDSVLNPFFIVCGQQHQNWTEALTDALSDSLANT